MPIFSFINEIYAVDTGRNVKAVYRTKGLDGKYTGSHTIYGYKKAYPDIQGMLYLYLVPVFYIIPIPPPAGIAGTSSLILATADSVVRSVDATEFAF